MKFIIDNWMLICVALTSGLMLFWPVIQGVRGRGLSVMEAVQKINREKALIIDVCTPLEFDAGHLPGAQNIPLDQLKDRLPQLAKNKTQTLLMVCTSGMRSRSAVDVAKNLGFDKASSLSGGMRAWREANQPVIKS